MTETTTETGTDNLVFRATISMGYGEYVSNCPPRDLVKELANKHPNMTLLVMVNEHGGWWEQYYVNPRREIDCLLVATANSSGRYHDEAERIRQELREMPESRIAYLPGIRRPARS